MATGAWLADRDRAERGFFGGMAAFIGVVVFLGFARSYYLRPLTAGQVPALPTLTPLIHVHAFLFSLWIALLVLQARLVAAGRIDLHRRFGLAGTALAVLMLAVGTLTALHGVVRGVSPGGMDPRRFLVVPLFALAVFGVLLFAAIRARHDPQSHKRLVLLATIALLPPALARWLIFQLGLGPPVVLAVSTLFLLPLVVWDLATRRRLHPATLWGGLFLVLSGPLRLAIATSDAWLDIASAAVALVS